MTQDMDIGLPDQNDPKITKITWTNRRYMAWTALISMYILLICILFFIPTYKVEAYTDIITTALWVQFSVVAFYMGSTSIPFIGFSRGVK